ncbi:MAG: SpoIID/LytB domain-containing protein [Nitrospinota bacterium]
MEKKVITLYSRRCLPMLVVMLSLVLATVASSYANSTVRVLLASSESKIEIRSDAKIIVEVENEREDIRSGEVIISSNGVGVVLNGSNIDSNRIFLSSKSPLDYKAKQYIGKLEIINDYGSFQLINHLPLELYIEGVVASEIAYNWPMESLKAQAIASRSYAIYHINRSANQPFDLKADVSSQVYNGIHESNSNIRKAVQATNGLVIKSSGKIAEALFHSSSGGKTEDIANLWSKEKRSYLISRPALDANSPYDYWEIEFNKDIVREALNKKGYKVGEILHITPASLTSSGRINNLRIVHSTPTQITLIDGYSFRAAIGSTKIRSTRFKVSYDDNSRFLFVGRGYGHGVGMSQYAAKNMAASGYTYQDILKYFYKGVRIEKLKKDEDQYAFNF